jgi:hypothetical protein
MITGMKLGPTVGRSPMRSAESSTQRATVSRENTPRKSPDSSSTAAFRHRRSGGLKSVAIRDLPGTRRRV